MDIKEKREREKKRNIDFYKGTTKRFGEKN